VITDDFCAVALAFVREKRRPHVLGCAAEAVRLAERWGTDAELAETAALLHDCTKAENLDGQLKMCEKYGIIIGEAEFASPGILHAMTGEALARERFSPPEEVLSAIRWHTTGRPDMSLLEKIIFLADLIEPTRDFPSIAEIRVLAYENLDTALKTGVAGILKMLIDERKPIYPATIETYNFLTKQKKTLDR